MKLALKIVVVCLIAMMSITALSSYLIARRETARVKEHEIGTPLNVVSGRAGMIRSGKLSQQELEESAEAMQSESNRIAGIVRQLMDFARHNPPKRASADLRIVVERTVELLKTLASKSGGCRLD